MHGDGYIGFGVRQLRESITSSVGIRSEKVLENIRKEVLKEKQCFRNSEVEQSM